MRCQSLQGKDQKSHVEVLEYTDDTGCIFIYERHECEVVVAEIEHGNKYKFLCEACPKYGKNLACPPYSPSFLQYIKDAKKAEVICLRLPTEYFTHPIAEERYRACFRMAKNLLTGELLKYRREGYFVAGSGTCVACERCIVEDGDQKCKRPGERIYSLESLGINVISFVKKCFNIDLDWNSDVYTADFVSAVGAVFFP